MDGCDPVTGVYHTPVNTEDGNRCTTDICDPATGIITHQAVDPNDNNPCTTDACDPSTGMISHTPVNTNDGNACTSDGCDSTGVYHNPVNTNDNNACTTDGCDPVTGVFHNPVNTSDNNPCTLDACDPSTGVITHTDATPTVTATGGTIACYNGTTCVTVTASGGQTPYTGTGTFCGYGQGTWTFTVTDGKGCSADGSVTLSQPTKVTVTTTTTPTGCSGNTGTATATATGGTGAYTYVWKNSSNATVGTSATATALGAGTYTVTVTDANGCTGTATAVVGSGSGGGVPPAPGPITGATSGCPSTCSNVYSIAPVAGATSYVWTLPSGASGSSTGTSITICFGSTFNGGYICVKAVSPCGTGPSTCKNITKTAYAPSTPGSITGPSSLCPNTSATYSINSVSGATSYEWGVVGSGLTIVSGQGTTSVVVSASSSFTVGSVYVKAKNCKGSSGIRYKILTGKPSMPVFQNCPPSSGVCGGSCYSFEVQNCGDATSWTWSAPAGSTITMSGVSGSGNPKTGPKNYVTICFPSGFISGNVTVYSTNSCGNSPTATLAVSSKPAAPGAISGPASGVCNTSGNNYSIAAVSGATSYTWTVPSNAQITNNYGTSIKVKFLSAFSSGSICVKANNNCGSSAQTCITVNAKPNTPGTITGNSSVCKSNTKTYSISSVSGATSYTWAATGGAVIQSGQGTTSVNVKFTSCNSSSVSLTVKANNACGSSATSAKTISVNLGCKVAADEPGDVSIVSSLSAYPNPTTGKATVTFNSDRNANYSLKVVDMIGNILISENVAAVEGTNTKEINLENVAQGLYIISVQTEGSQAETMRLIVE
jgi:hypothetical protein